MVVEALRHVARHFQVLGLIPPHRHVRGVEQQDVSAHQHRVVEQAHGNALIRVFTGLDVGLHGGLVGVRAVHQTLGTDTAQQPGEFRDFRHIRLPVKHHAFGIQPQRQPTGGNRQR